MRRIPAGRVATYGRIATWLGSPRAARAVGYAMFNAPDDVPWHRVVNSRGEISIGGHLHRPDLQRRLLEEEGVELSAQGAIHLPTYLWEGPFGAPEANVR